MMRKTLLLLMALVFLAACKTDLYSNVTEREANEMMGALRQNGILAWKTAGRDNVFSVQVDTSDISDALMVLDARGLPRGSRQSIGQVFQRSGMISSPFEERVRYIYALGEEVAQTIQQIEGVLVARVHIVMPEEPALGQTARPASAAVFIRQRAGVDLQYLAPQVRRLVSSAIEGVNYDDVSIIYADTVESTPNIDPSMALTQVMPGLAMHRGSVMTFWLIIGGMSAVIVLLIAVLLWTTLRGNGGRRAGDSDEETA